MPTGNYTFANERDVRDAAKLVRESRMYGNVKFTPPIVQGDAAGPTSDVAEVMFASELGNEDGSLQVVIPPGKYLFGSVAVSIEANPEVVFGNVRHAVGSIAMLANTGAVMGQAGGGVAGSDIYYFNGDLGSISYLQFRTSISFLVSHQNTSGVERYIAGVFPHPFASMNRGITIRSWTLVYKLKPIPGGSSPPPSPNPNPTPPP